MNRVGSCLFTRVGNDGCYVMQVVMDEDDSGRGKLAETDYKVLSVPERAPQRCCLMQLQPITGQHSQHILVCIL